MKIATTSAGRLTLVITGILVLTAGLIFGSGLAVPSGSWVTTDSMNEARANAAAVLLPDGRVLVIGGEDGGSLSASVEAYGLDDAFASLAPMHMARARHTATLLPDGRVLVVGGETLAEGPTNSVEVYSPADDSWEFVASLSESRAGHSATLLQNGTVLIAGGEAPGGSIRSSLEIYNPLDDVFEYAGNLSSPRVDHAAAASGSLMAGANSLVNERVLFIGGSDGSGALASIEVYDPASGDISSGGNLPEPRQGHSATTLMGGWVYVAGGNNGSADLASGLIIKSDLSINPSAASLSNPRSGHIAVRLPDNNCVMLAGGSGSTSVDIYTPWVDTIHATGSMGAARSDAAASPLAYPGRFLAAGGQGLSSAELYGFATVRTDKEDYQPGEFVTVTGEGWVPGESVELVFNEVPAMHDPEIYYATADASGNIFNNEKGLEIHDIGVRYYLVATGQTSGLSARNTFSDAPAANLDQCRNGAADSPANCAGSQWVNGNAGEQNSHYAEGFSIPYRVRMTDLPSSGTITVDLEYDFTHSDKVAIDFVTHYACMEPHLQFGHAAESVDPTTGTAFSGAATSTELVDSPVGEPLAAVVFGLYTADIANRCNGILPQISLWGGTFVADSFEYLSEGTVGTTNTSTRFRVSFTPDGSGTALLAWGGHIASRLDWGLDADNFPFTAGAISGSPYHTRLIDWNLSNLGNQDRSLSGASVIPVGTITIRKETDPADEAGPFGFSLTGAISDTFSLGDNEFDTTEPILTPNGGVVVTVTEDSLPAGWDLASITDCMRLQPDGSQGVQAGIQSEFAIDVPNDQVVITLKDGEDVECTFNNELLTGKIEVVKDLVPDADPGRFDLLIKNSDGTQTIDEEPNAGDGGTTGENTVNAGTYQVSEVGGDTPATSLSDYAISVTCIDEANGNAVVLGPTSGAGPHNVDVDANDDIKCTFTNTKNGSITIIKDAVPDDAQDFSYQASGDDVAAFDLDDDADGTLSNTKVFSGLQPGIRTITEDGETGWELTNIVCSGGSSVDIQGSVDDGDFDAGDDAVEIDLQAGEDVTCTFTNTKNGSITIIKDTVPDGPQDFSYQASGAGVSGFSVDDDADGTLSNTKVFSDLQPGVRTITEDGETGFVLTNIVCSGGSSVDIQGSVDDGDFDAGDDAVEIDLQAGEDVTCTFTNTEEGSITIIKDASPEDDTQFDYTASGSDVSNFDLNDPSDNTKVFSNLLPGTRTITETVPSDWNLTNIVCSGGSSVDIQGSVDDGDFDAGDDEVEIDLQAGEDVTCTFSNEMPDAKISIGPTATNELGATHIFTVTVMVDSDGDGQFDDPVPTNAHVSFDSIFDNPDTLLPPVPGDNGVRCVVDLAASSCDDADGNLDGNGECTIEFASAPRGQCVGHAEVDVTIDGVVLHRETDGNAPNSDDAIKTFVGARINVTPTEDTNPVGTDHVLTVSVDIGDGIPDNGNEPNLINGIDDFEPAPDGTFVSCQITSGPGSFVDDGFDIPENPNGLNPPSTFESDLLEGNDCLTSGGSCDITIHSDDLGTTTVSCATEVIVGGVVLTRSTNGSGPNGPPAIKHWEGRTITIVKDAIPDSHQDFEFSGSGDGINPTSFFLDDNDSLGDPDPATDQPVSIAFVDLLPGGGPRVFSEINIPTEWALTSIICVDTDTGQAADVDSTIEFTGADPDPAFQQGDTTVSLTLAVGENLTCTFTNVSELQGCTPGYWKNHTDRWEGFAPEDLVKDVFTSAANSPYEELGDATLLQALMFQGGSSLADKAQILLRAAVAAVLNAAHNEVAYGMSVGEIQAAVNAALDSQDPEQILALATDLDIRNNQGCPLGGSPSTRGNGRGRQEPSSGETSTESSNGGRNRQESTTSSASSSTYSTSTSSSLDSGSSLIIGGMTSMVSSTSPADRQYSSTEESSSTPSSDAPLAEDSSPEPTFGGLGLAMEDIELSTRDAFDISGFWGLAGSLY